MMIEKINQAFRKQFATQGVTFASPGRVNIIGEHTDYNLGFVMPGAIDKAIYAEIKPNGGTLCRVYSVDYDEYAEFDINSTETPAKEWLRYPYGVVREIMKLGRTIEGFDCVFGGDVPLGAGLSSSAALESVMGFAINHVFGLGLTLLELARVGQMCEHNYVGVRCGIMDQFASLFGKKGEVIRLDCRSLEYKMAPFDPVGYRVVLIDTQVKHSLASSQYNVRREQCEAGVAVVKKHVTGVESLRDVTMDMLNSYKGEMEPIVYQRCSFIVSENQRVMDACAALDRGDYVAMGQLMFASHQGLSKMYEVSCPELDFLADNAAAHNGVIGARMMGGGFGGCTINVVKDSEYDSLIDQLTTKYKKQFNITPRVINVTISDGARLV